MKYSINCISILSGLALLQDACAASIQDDPELQQYIRLNANVLRGNTYASAQKGAQAKFIEKRDTDGIVTMELISTSSFYQVDLEIGSEKQAVSVLLDTGSSDLWVTNSNNTYCSSNTKKLARKGRKLGDIIDLTSSAPIGLNKRDDENGGPDAEGQTSGGSSSTTIDCSTYGTFDPDSSSSFVSNGTAFSIVYADETFANGTWGYDDVTFNGVTVDNLSFAVADATDSTVGVFGIGLPGLEVTYSGTSATSNYYMYENLPYKMVSQGLTKTPSYSIYLNDTDSSTASILFSGIDHDKYTGDLTLLPIVNTLSSYGYKDPIRIEITLSSFGVADSSSKATVASGAAAALLDTGTTLTYIPDDIMSELADLLSLRYSSSLGAYYMSCADGASYNVTFDFCGAEINAPLTSFLIEIETGRQSSSSDYCALGLMSSGDDTFTLGDSFLRNVYFVADLDNYQVGIAQANLDSDSENIEVISSSIPSAVSAASYSSTWGEDYTQLSVSSATFQLAPSVTGTDVSVTALSGKSTSVESLDGTTLASATDSPSDSSSTSGDSSSTTKSAVNKGGAASNGVSPFVMGLTFVLSLAALI